MSTGMPLTLLDGYTAPELRVVIADLREVNRQLIAALKTVTSSLSSARLAMTDTETRAMASGIVATALMLIAAAEEQA